MVDKGAREEGAADCRRCQQALVPGAAFCVHCGARAAQQVAAAGVLLAGAAPEIPRAGTVASPATYVYRRRPEPTPDLSPRAGAVLRALLPLDRSSWLSVRRRRDLLIFLTFAVAPFVILRGTDGDADIERAAWGFAVYFGAAWLLAIHALVRPEPLPRRRLVGVAAFTVVVGAALAITMEELLAGGGDGFVDMVLRVGLPEEVSKVLPVALFLLFGGLRHSPRAFLFVGALSGITFGATEAVLYTVLYDDMAAHLGTSTTVETVWRLVCGGLVHGCLTGVAALCVGLAAWHRQSRTTLLVVGIGVPALLHGAYNASSSSWLGVVLAGCIAGCFVLCTARCDDIALSLPTGADR